MTVDISTERPQLCLRELASDSDDIAYFNAIEASREHLSQFSQETVIKYPDIAAVKDARLHPASPDKLRLGIWDSEVFVGSINLTPDEYGAAEVGYWLDARYTGQGYATMATRALAKYGSRRYTALYAHVAEANMASAAVLERAGFQELAKQAGTIVFGMSGLNQPARHQRQVKPKPELISSQDLERFADLPNRREALRAKDKDNTTIFLSFGIAKKLYHCFCCSNDIAIGSSHAVLGRVQTSKRYTHHHVDFTCVQEKVLPTLSDIQIIKPEAASETAVNAHRRKHRYRNRGSA